jgi:hypothetical protein
MTTPQNPYQAPRADVDANAAVPVNTAAASMNMPTSVKTCVALMIAAAVIAMVASLKDGKPPVQLFVVGLLLWGVFKRSALAWQWVRIGGVLAGVVTASVAASMILNNDYSATAIAFIAASMGLAAVFYLLPVFLVSTASARRFFRVVCPSCGSTRVKARDFVYREKRCKDCPATWR